MPEYPYKCLDCKYDFIIVRKMTDVAKTQCPQCKSEKLKRVFTTNFILNGLGWAKEKHA